MGMGKCMGGGKRFVEFELIMGVLLCVSWKICDFNLLYLKLRINCHFS